MSLPVRLARNALRRRELAIQALDIPIFLCPALQTFNPLRPSILNAQRRPLHSQVAESSPAVPALSLKRALPRQCQGCGAFSQTTDENEPGFYQLQSKRVQDFLLEGHDVQSRSQKAQERDIIEKALQNAGPELAMSLNINVSSPSTPAQLEEHPLPCDRCHNIDHHHSGTSIKHPSIEAIQQTIFESPHKYNHIYHVLDAADFPMSLIPQIHRLLDITPQRSLNRRSKSGKFFHGRKTEISFIITRSDLLAPMKGQVDRMMPYLIQVLRDALGRDTKNARLGNVTCVSAKRDWWTGDLKEEIWERGGAGWMVGKVNVGKSQLFAKVFPKGRLSAPELMKGVNGDGTSNPAIERHFGEKTHPLSIPENLDPNSLLPPALPEVNYPSMPLVSALPGTTASPIRVPYGSGKGELIDLPGLSRGELELYVQPKHRSSLVMRQRVVPKKQVLKASHSLLIGGLIRITPVTPYSIFLVYSFTPLSAHLTATEKAIGIQERLPAAPNVENIALPETAKTIRSAGRFKLKWDVTRQQAGPLTRRDAVGMRPDQLPFVVLSADILIEGCGWVEITTQVRRKEFERWEMDNRGEFEGYPEVEVFSPEGRFIAARQPMNGWILGGPKPKPVSERRGRPRPSMKGHKKQMKVLRREQERKVAELSRANN